MQKEEFKSFVSQQSKTVVPTIDWDKKRDEWLEGLEGLYKAIRSFLDSYQEISIDSKEVDISEEYIGTYKAPSLHLQIGSNKIKLVPKGTNIIGASGRVDMEGPKGTKRFVLVEHMASAQEALVKRYVESGMPSDGSVPADKREWKIATPPPQVSLLPLTQESFFDMIVEVING